MGALVFLVELVAAWRARSWAGIPKTLLWTIALPLALYLIAPLVVGKTTPFWIDVLFSMILVIPLGPMIYRLVFQPVAEASVLVLLIVAVAVHFVMTGLALVFFGAEGWRTPPFLRGDVNIGHVTLSAQRSFGLGTLVATLSGPLVFFVLN